MLSCQNKSLEHGSSLAFFYQKKKAHLPAKRITEQPILLTKRKIIPLAYKCSKYFR